MNIAGEVFAEEGYSSASMSNIASRLGGSKGTLYNYFKSKEELFHAHVEDRCCLVRAAFEQELTGDDPLPALAGVAERLLTLLISPEAIAFYTQIVSEAQRDPGVGRAFYDSGPRRGRLSIARYLETARANGRIVVEDCEQAAGDFLSLVTGGLYWRRLLNVIPPPSPAEIHAEALRAAQIFVRAYAPGPTAPVS